MKSKFSNSLVFIADFFTLNFAWILYFYFRTETGWFLLLSEPLFFVPMLAVYIYWLIVFSFLGMYRPWFALSRLDEISNLFKATILGVLILFFLIFVDDVSHGVNSENRFLIFIYWGFLFVFVSVGRFAIRSLQRNLLIRGIGRKNALIVGFNKKAHEIEYEISKHPALGIDVVGYLAVYPENLSKSNNNINVIGMVNDVERYIQEKNIQEIIIALEHHHEEILIEVIGKCENHNVGLKLVPHLYEILSGQARTSQLYGLPLIDVNPQLMPEWEKKAKRILDILLSFIILIVASPVFLLIGIAIKLDSKGPVFYRQERCGLNGKLFKVIKFRSMRQDAEKATGPVWSQKDDPRVTKVGKFLRKVRLDEIPQFINVLKGEMSLVGPRPERPYFVEKLSIEIPYYKRRLKVKPGITGWAQVKHKYDETIEDVKEKIKFDLFYIENMSLRMDFKILFRTIFVVMFGKGHYD
ncbi:MAG TPA: undecaprenyl-phosphate glucose phosphotransferase [Ignavibacteriaceae bacterium]|nr:undecaprenyl-phosphate glucose phosphotransferase [Ignavibacteriaceae bacterium]